jgi:hypothetical protein
MVGTAFAMSGMRLYNGGKFNFKEIEMDETKKPEEIVKSIESVESSSPELPEAELNQVVGGAPKLYDAGAKGTHIPEVTIELW